MRFSEIYERIIGHWGDVVLFSDGNITNTNNKTPGTTPTQGSSFYSKKLGEQWSKVEDIVGNADTYGDLMVWTMYQVFHRHAIELFRQGVSSFVPKEIDIAEIESQYSSNLHSEGWEAELSDYVRDIE